MKKRLAIAFLSLSMLLTGAVVVFSPSIANAQINCRCFCSSEEGAIDLKLIDLEQCETQCAQLPGGRMLSCPDDSNFAAFPGNNPRCFDQTACTAVEGVLDTKFQPPECLPEEHYCYPANPESIPLAIRLGGTTTVQDIGAYISAGYNYLLGIGVTLTIIFLMIGGVQYLVSGGASEGITKAKTRMKNAVIGLVLLLGAYVILFTINPNLVRLEVPRLPLVKNLTFVGEGDNCGALENEGFKIDTKGKAKVCGQEGELTEGPPGVNVVAGKTCTYTTCPPGNTCYGTGDQALCIGCADYHEMTTNNLPITSSLCSQLKKPDKLFETGDRKGEKEFANFCFHAFDGDISEDRSTGSCAELNIDCKKVNTCQDYESLRAKSGTKTAKMEDVEPGGNVLGLVDTLDIQTLCALDPCRVGQRTGVHCEYSTGATGLADDCIPN